MSIEQVGSLDCWPITGNHSAPQLSPPGRGGGLQEREQLSGLQAGKELHSKDGEPAAAPLPRTHPWAVVDGEALGDTSLPRALPEPYIELCIQVFFLCVCVGGGYWSPKP